MFETTEELITDRILLLLFPVTILNLWIVYECNNRLIQMWAGAPFHLSTWNWEGVEALSMFLLFYSLQYVYIYRVFVRKCLFRHRY